MLRARAEARPADSISHFRRHLHVLQRTGPTAVRPANTLRIPNFVPPAPAPSYRMPRNYSPQVACRARTLKRRRDILFTLLAAMGATLVLGFLPPLRMLWVPHVVLDVVFGVYVALLVRARGLAAEREMKLRFMPAHARADNVLLLRRSAN
ncbi:MAG TPA: hypothetical protein VMZ51_08360 [Acidimicrobiales bacterium]|nr:hypothetical protein [Acidimicrobiales bacterium]